MHHKKRRDVNLRLPQHEHDSFKQVEEFEEEERVAHQQSRKISNEGYEPPSNFVTLHVELLRNEIDQLAANSSCN